MARDLGSLGENHTVRESGLFSRLDDHRIAVLGVFGVELPHQFTGYGAEFGVGRLWGVGGAGRRNRWRRALLLTRGRLRGLGFGLGAGLGTGLSCGLGRGGL